MQIKKIKAEQYSKNEINFIICISKFSENYHETVIKLLLFNIMYFAHCSSILVRCHYELFN